MTMTTYLEPISRLLDLDENLSEANTAEVDVSMIFLADEQATLPL